MHSIDLNCDLGEGCGNDAELMRFITSANIACGFHAGDLDTMKRTVDLAIENGVAIGAHPSYADRENFGRTDQYISLDEVRRIVQDQIETLASITEKAGTRLRHVKPHGALYNRSARDVEIARTIAETVRDIDPKLVVFGLSGSHSISEAEKLGLKTSNEVFADRTYQNDASLTPRARQDALITDDAIALAQVLDMIRYGRVRTTDGIMIRIQAGTVCIHGDGQHAVKFARKIGEALTSSQIEIRPCYD